MNECSSCVQTTRIDALESDSERNSSQHREFYSKFSKLETKMAVSDEKYNTLLQTVNEVKTIVTELKDKPAKRWDSVSMYIITTIVGAIIGFLLNFILLGGIK